MAKLYQPEKEDDGEMRGDGERTSESGDFYLGNYVIRARALCMKRYKSLR